MATGYPDYFRRTIITAQNSEQLKLSVTSSQTTGTFTQTVLAWFIYNDGPYNVHFKTSTGVTTDNFKIPSGSYFGVDIPITILYFICASSETATVYVIGVY